MIGCLVGLLVVWLVGCLALVSCLVGWLVGWLVGSYHFAHTISFIPFCSYHFVRTIVFVILYRFVFYDYKVLNGSVHPGEDLVKMNVFYCEFRVRVSITNHNKSSKNGP